MSLFLIVSNVLYAGILAFLCYSMTMGTPGGLSVCRERCLICHDSLDEMLWEFIVPSFSETWIANILFICRAKISSKALNLSNFNVTEARFKPLKSSRNPVLYLFL